MGGREEEIFFGGKVGFGGLWWAPLDLAAVALRREADR